MRARKKRYCNRCGEIVRRETEKGLRSEYPFFCPNCDENMYKFETHTQGRKKMKKYFTREELLETIIDHLQDYRGYYEELHHEVFNTSVYIQETQKAEQALEEYGIYTAVGKVYLYEKNNFGEVYTNLSNPVKLAYMLWYILGFEIMLELDLFEYYGLADEETNKELITKLEAQLNQEGY